MGRGWREVLKCGMAKADPDTERFAGRFGRSASRYVSREYRNPFVLLRWSERDRTCSLSATVRVN